MAANGMIIVKKKNQNEVIYKIVELILYQHLWWWLPVFAIYPYPGYQSNMLTFSDRSN